MYRFHLKGRLGVLAEGMMQLEKLHSWTGVPHYFALHSPISICGLLKRDRAISELARRWGLPPDLEKRIARQEMCFYCEKKR